ncbi:hypothetical protein N0V83_005170 [Neocucurbitaria cava]|uniref:Uncharacterized protein n=1 Tax=Neocucurbitaria cava TaxID=798079 RepID=A0A9W9CMR2_9PLEO|nr:hypothetical protein N0V83_005170 [Neocucurbitaria cava]
MAFNSWDKLSKAQRDYPKTKFAVAVVDKALKKNPKNPFIRTCAEASRRSSGTLKIGSIGPVLLKPWQNAAKALGRKQDRLGLWDALFTAAMREDFWEDAVVNYNKEGSPSKKLAHYAHILAVQLAAEQKEDPASNSSRMCAIQFSLARKLMKQAYEASPDDPIAVKDIRDLRFMAEIFRRQGQHAELFSLWDNPPISLKKLLRTHRDDLMSLKTRILREQEDWPLLEAHCYASIEEVISLLNLAQDSKSLWELCAWRWDLWNGLMEATAAIRPGQE